MSGAASQQATRCHTWSATWWRVSSTPRRSASPSRPTPSHAGASSVAPTATHGRACWWPTTPSTSPRRGAVSRAAALIDQHGAANPASDGSAGELGALFAEAQAAKAFVNEAAGRIVDRALALSGGAGYVNGSPLARATATSRRTFMHPLGANRAATSPTSPSANSRRCTEMISAGHAQVPAGPDARSFRDALGRFATGVAFVSGAPDDEPAG